jgi:hypothetical protein
MTNEKTLACARMTNEKILAYARMTRKVARVTRKGSPSSPN